MSITIPVAFVDQFSANVHMLAEQRMSRLRSTVMVQSVTGDSWAVERLGGIDTPNAVTTRHGDTPLNSTPHTRRWGFVADYDVADLIDKQDRVKLLIDPDSKYTIRHAGTMGRAVDDAIITALGASVVEGHTGTASPTAFDTANQEIASGSTGMTVSKLIQAKEKLDAAEVDEFYTRYFILGSRQLRELLEDDKIASQDYNTVKALVRGEIDQYLGFTFIRTERLPVASSIRSCYAYVQPAIDLRFAQEPNSIASDRPDKRHAKQIYTYGSWGALRTEDVMVVRVLSDES